MVWAPGLPGHVRGRGRGQGRGLVRGLHTQELELEGGAWARGKWDWCARGRGLDRENQCCAGRGGAERGHRLPALSTLGPEHAQCGARADPALCSLTEENNNKMESGCLLGVLTSVWWRSFTGTA